MFDALGTEVFVRSRTHARTHARPPARTHARMHGTGDRLLAAIARPFGAHHRPLASQSRQALASLASGPSIAGPHNLNPNLLTPR